MTYKIYSKYGNLIIIGNKPTLKLLKGGAK
jgi:hypothetical protein